jgi:hypothetical protein
MEIEMNWDMHHEWEKLDFFFESVGVDGRIILKWIHRI